MLKLKKHIAYVLIISLLSINLFGCTNMNNKATINIGAIKGPSGIGMVNLMNSNDQHNSKNDYNFEISGDPYELVGKITSGELDLACLPTNVGATLYNKMDENIQMLSITTLGILYIVTNGEEVNSIQDLKGKTIHATGQGSVPQYALEYILKQNGIDPNKDVTIEYMQEHAQLATEMIAERVNIAMLPEPFVTQTLNKNKNIKVSLNLTEEWDKCVNSESLLTMGCLVGRKDFIEDNKDAINNFLQDYKFSCEKANNDIEQTAILTQKYDIMDENIALQAIPNCNIVYIDSTEMKDKTKMFLQVLLEQNPGSIGGKLPGEDFYYEK